MWENEYPEYFVYKSPKEIKVLRKYLVSLGGKPTVTNGQSEHTLTQKKK